MAGDGRRPGLTRADKLKNYKPFILTRIDLLERTGVLLFHLRDQVVEDLVKRKHREFDEIFDFIRFKGLIEIFSRAQDF